MKACKSKWFEDRCKECTGFFCAKKSATGWCWESDSFSRLQRWRLMSRTLSLFDPALRTVHEGETRASQKKNRTRPNRRNRPDEPNKSDQSMNTGARSTRDSMRQTVVVEGDKRRTA